jgi:hypothetical protein
MGIYRRISKVFAKRNNFNGFLYDFCFFEVNTPISYVTSESPLASIFDRRITLFIQRRNITAEFQLITIYEVFMFDVYRFPEGF